MHELITDPALLGSKQSAAHAETHSDHGNASRQLQSAVAAVEQTAVNEDGSKGGSSGGSNGDEGRKNSTPGGIVTARLLSAPFLGDEQTGETRASSVGNIQRLRLGLPRGEEEPSAGVKPLVELPLGPGEPFVPVPSPREVFLSGGRTGGAEVTAENLDTSAPKAVGDPDAARGVLLSASGTGPGEGGSGVKPLVELPLGYGDPFATDQSSVDAFLSNGQERQQARAVSAAETAAPRDNRAGSGGIFNPVAAASIIAAGLAEADESTKPARGGLSRLPSNSVTRVGRVDGLS